MVAAQIAQFKIGTLVFRYKTIVVQFALLNKFFNSLTYTLKK